MLQFQQSEQTAERRRWILVLVDSTDGVTGKTGQSGSVFISKNGAAGVASTNGIVEVDVGDMPGHYYVELTAAELDTLGHISISYKAADTLAFHDRAIVSYNDPYVSTGGFSSGSSGSGFKLTNQHIELIAKKVWEYQVAEDVTAQSKLLEAANHPITDLSGIESRFADIVIPETDLTGLSDQIANIKFPVPVDYTNALSDIRQAVDGFKVINMDGLSEAVAHFNTKMEVATEEINSSMATVSEIKQGFIDLKSAAEELSSKVSEMSDMDKRFENMTSTMQKQELNSLVEKLDDSIKKLLITVTESKFDIIEEINNK